MSHDRPTPTLLDDARTGMNLLAAVTRAWAVSMEVFLHRNMGARYPGLPGAAVLLLVPAWGCFWGGHDLRPLFVFLGAYLVACVCHRIDFLRRSRRIGVTGHSYYNGLPRVWRFVPALPELRVKQVVEPLVVLVVGLGCAVWNRPLGGYLIGGAVSLFVSGGLCELLTRQQAMDLNDDMIDQEILAERVRELRGDR